jgi:hypothetical protein
MVREIQVNGIALPRRGIYHWLVYQWFSLGLFDFNNLPTFCSHELGYTF